MSQAAPDRVRAKWLRPLPAKLAKSMVDTSKLVRKSVLTTPHPDLAGDIVIPAGIDWRLHRRDPYIDLEHGRDPSIKGMPVAWACKSLHKREPGEVHDVVLKSLNFGGDGQPDDYQDVWIGGEYFDPNCRVSMQVFALCEQDATPARSLEFQPVRGRYKALGRSPLEDRYAYQFDAVEPIRWSICGRGVNEYALQSLSKSLGAVTQVPDALGKILADKKLNVGGTVERLHERIYKALLPAAPERPKPNRVRVERSMIPDDETPDDDDAQLDTVNDAALTDLNGNGAPDATEGGSPSNGIGAVYAHAQALLAACDQLEADLENTDSPELYRDGKKLCDMTRALAKKVKGTGDAKDAKLQAMKSGKPADDGTEGEKGEGAEADDADEEDEPDDEETDIERDKDGVLKAVRPPYQVFLKAGKRFKFADLDALAPVARASEPAPPETAAEAIARIERDDPDGFALIAAAADRRRKAQAWNQ